MRGKLDRYVVAAIAVVGVMAMIAVAGFGAAVSSWSFLWSVAVAVVGAALIAVVAHGRRLLLGESVAITAVSFIVLGGIAAGGVPTPGAYGDFFDGLVNGWADFLSSPAPVDLTPAFRVLPFTIAWFATAVGAEIARHSRRPGLPAIGPILGLGLTLLFTIEDRSLAVAQGAGILAGTLVLVSLAHRLGVPRTAAATDDQLDGRALAGDRTRLALGGLVLVGAVVAAPFLGPRLPLADAHERFDLRRYQVPPFDPLALPSPLVQVKANLKENRKDDVVFTITGDPVELWPVAVMTDYDGVVWTVGDPERNRVQAEFAPVDTELPELDRAIPEDAPTRTHTVQIRDLGGFFLPTAGVAERISFDGPDPDPRMNLTTGTIALPGGARPGLTYEVTSAVPPQVSEAALAETAIQPVDYSDDLELLPPGVLNLTADVVQGQARGWPQMDAIRDALVDAGFYDATDETPPGHSFGRLAQMLEDPDQIVGYEEQYAAAAGLMARTASLPVRVVVGYRVPADRWSGGRPRSPPTTSRRGSRSTPASGAGCRSRSPRRAIASPTRRATARPSSRWPSPTRRLHRRPRPRSSRPARRIRTSTRRRSSRRSGTRGRPVVRARRRGSRWAPAAARSCWCWASSPSWSAGRRGGGGGAGPSPRPPGASPGRGPRPPTGPSRPGLPCSCAPRRTRPSAATSASARTSPSSSPTCACWPARWTAPRMPPCPRATTTPTRPGRPATASPPTCGRAGACRPG